MSDLRRGDAGSLARVPGLSVLFPSMPDHRPRALARGRLPGSREGRGRVRFHGWKRRRVTRPPHGRSSGRYFIAVKAHPFATGGLCCVRAATITPVTYLVDGYNLLYAIGLANRNLPAKGLERARSRLLDWLADRMKGRDALVRVVFDAQNSPAPSSESCGRLLAAECKCPAASDVDGTRPPSAYLQ